MNARQFLKIITSVNVLVAAGFAVAGVFHHATMIQRRSDSFSQTDIFALYAAARALPLAGIILVLLGNEKLDGWITIGILAAIIQLLDGLIGVYQQDASKAVGPFLLSLATFAAVYLTMIRNRSAINIQKTVDP